MGALTDYLENKLIDQLLRGQTYSFPSTMYMALFTSTPSDTGGGTEVSGTGYARVSIACTMANWSGTQGTGTTVASTGTAGTTYNNSAITFGSPTASWGTITAVGLYDASSGGNLLIWSLLTTSKTVNSGDAAPSFAASSFSFQIDS